MDEAASGPPGISAAHSFTNCLFAFTLFNAHQAQKRAKAVHCRLQALRSMAHTLFAQNWEAEGGKKQDRKARMILSFHPLALDHFSLPGAVRGDRKDSRKGRAVASAECSSFLSRLSGAPALPSWNGNECLHVKSTKAIS